MSTRSKPEGNAQSDGKKSAGPIPLSVPVLQGNEWAYVKECLDTGWVSSVGPFVDQFEQRTAHYLGASHAVAVVNGTAALHLALLIAGVQPDDEVLIPTLTFIATANAVRYAGAWPVLMDAERDFWQMDAEKVRRFLETECRWEDGGLRNRATGRRIKAVVPVHTLGHPVDLDPLLDVAQQYGLTVIEDAAESIGSRYKGRMTGTLGDLACFSFNGNKIITTGGGGMLVTSRQDWATRAKYLSTQAKDDPVEYLHNEVGFNYRLTNLQAAMGCAQLENLDAYIAAKRRIAARYRIALADVPGLTPMPEAPWAFSNHWLFTVLVDPARYGRSNRELMQTLHGFGIQTRPLWQPMHQSPAHRGAQSYQIEVADDLSAQALSLPCSVNLTEADQEHVVAAIRNLEKSRGS